MREQYDFSAFLNRISDLEYQQMIQEAEREASEVESLSFSVKGAVERRASDSINYFQQIDSFIFFLNNGKKPGGATEEEFQLFKPLCEKLVLKGQFLPTILSVFDPVVRPI